LEKYKQFLPSLSLLLLSLTGVAAGCRQPIAPRETVPPRNVVLITIDTLRADRIGAYGYGPARTPAIDALAARGTRFVRAYAAAPITLTSHASILSGRYPPGHGARHNGVRVNGTVPLLAEGLGRAGFQTLAFVGAFPLDRRFGLDRGFQVYDDRMPRAGGKPANERPGQSVVDSALQTLRTQRRRDSTGEPGKIFLWIHMFEPHAPYGAAGDTRQLDARYDDEVAEADRQVGRIVEFFGAERDTTLFVVSADHGEAFGEHGEIAHSLFLYDTTLRVPLVVAGPGADTQVVETPVGLVDVAPTLMRAAGAGAFDADGVDLSAALRGSVPSSRTLYAETFAPLLDFGWSPLRSVRDAEWKLIEAPRPELYQTIDWAESRDLASTEPARVAELRQRVERYAPRETRTALQIEPDAAARLQALGYTGTSTGERSGRIDPKDRRELAADIARVMSGEFSGTSLEAALRRILAADPANPQANLRLGFVLQESSRCPEALRHFRAAIDGGLPGADPRLGLAACHVAGKRFDAAEAALRDADRAEPDNPVVLANLGIVASDSGHPARGITALERAISLDPDFHQARFNLALAFARAGRRADAARQAEELLRRLPVTAPQRAEVARLLAAVR
jgi:choline-sulfatase